jgi:putative phosphotransacetylase
MEKNNTMKVMIESSARHVHLSQKAIDKLFGKNYKLTKLRRLSQPDEFACNEVVSIKGATKATLNARVLGPVRDYTQVEVSMTDARVLGIDPPSRASGDLNGSAPITIIGPKGVLRLKHGAILAWRHIHCSEKQAKKYSLKHGQLVSVQTNGFRAVSFDRVRIKVNPKYDWCMHIDTDEANACGLSNEHEKWGTVISNEND